MLSKILRFLRIQTPDQYRVIAALDDIERSFKSGDAFDMVAMRECIREAKLEVERYGVDVQGWPLADAAAYHVMSYVQRQLRTGRYHLIQGMLTPAGRGYRNVFDFALKRLETSGRYSASQAADARQRLGDDIDNAG